MTESISLRDANQRFARIIRAVEEGREFVITRRGQPVARISPAVRGGGKLTPEQEAALAHLEAIAAKGYSSDDTPFDRARRCMTVERFTLDTNILVYAIDQRDRARQRLATAILRAAPTKDCILTAQSLCEFYSAATRRVHLPPTDAAEVCRDYAKLFKTVGYDRAHVERALTEAVAGRMAFWDALLVATAEANGCAIVFSEDMADGARLGGATVRNPFAGSELSPTARRLTGLRKA